MTRYEDPGVVRRRHRPQSGHQPTSYSVVRVLPEGSQVAIYCQRSGTTVTGPYGTSNIWDNISNGQYVSDAYIYTGSDGYVASRCV
ncbi:peptidase [Streptomyces cellulosae]